jgi:hypothetical protein
MATTCSGSQVDAKLITTGPCGTSSPERAGFPIYDAEYAPDGIFATYVARER